MTAPTTPPRTPPRTPPSARAATSPVGGSAPPPVFGPAAGRALAAWMLAAVGTSVLAPVAVLARWPADPAVRRALGPVLGVLAVQIAVETVAVRRLPPWVVLVTGTSATTLRLRQLRTARDRLAAAGTPGAAAAGAVVGVARLFWSANLLVLALGARPLVRARVPVRAAGVV